MSDSVSRFESLIDKINIVYGLVVPVGLMTVAAALLWGFTPEYFQPGSFWIWVAVIASVGAIFALHYKLIGKLKRAHVRLLYFCYHAALMIFGIFVAPYLSPFDFLWVILAIGMDLLFGRKWLILTFLLYFISLVFGAGQNHIALSSTVILVTITQASGAVGTALLVSHFREISDAERHALDSTSHNTALERQRLLSLINSMGEAVIATDHEGKILIYNASVLSLFDTNVSLEGKNIEDVLNLHNRANKKVHLMPRVHESNTSFSSSELTHNFTSNDKINLFINVSTVKLGFGANDQNSYIAIIRDITKEKSLEDERDEFISVVSHELRTPAAIAEGDISNAIFFAEKHKTNQETLKVLGQAHDKVVFLSDMINDLATLSRAERTDYKLEITELNIQEFVNQLQQDYEADATAKGLKLTSTCSKGIGTLTTAELYLHEILQNFITNAIKYTKKGHVLVNAHRSDNKIIFSVADSGIGLSKSDQKRVFDKFWRSEDYRTRESSGTGLGLYVTHKLAQKLDAKIDMQSEINHGTTFTITLPNIMQKSATNKSKNN